MKHILLLNLKNILNSVRFLFKLHFDFKSAPLLGLRSNIKPIPRKISVLTSLAFTIHPNFVNLKESY